MTGFVRVCLYLFLILLLEERTYSCKNGLDSFDTVFQMSTWDVLKGLFTLAGQNPVISQTMKILKYLFKSQSPWSYSLISWTLTLHTLQLMNQAKTDQESEGRYLENGMEIWEQEGPMGLDRMWRILYDTLASSHPRSSIINKDVFYWGLGYLRSFIDQL